MAPSHPPRLARPQAGFLLAALLLTGAPAAAGPADEGDDQYRFLVGLVEKEMYELAVDEGQAFLRDHPRHEKAPLARYRLATSLFALERWEAAATQFEPLTKRRKFEYRAESAFRLGQCLLSRDQLPAAETAFELVTELDQDYLHGPATFFLAETAFRTGRTDEAEGRYRRLVQQYPDSEHVAGARRGLTWCAWERRDVKQTTERARTYLRHHGREETADEVRVLLGEALLEGQSPREALEVFQSVSSEAFDDARLRGTGFAHAALGDHATAAGDFAGLLEAHPRSRFADEARLQLGIQTLRAGDARAAAETLRRAARAGDLEAAYWFAQAQDAAGDPEGALETLERTLGAEPGGELAARIQVARGDLLNRLGRVDAALVAYESGGSDYALYAAAVAALNRGDGESAARLVTRLIEDHPESSYVPQSRVVLGEAFFVQEDHTSAEQVFASILSGEASDEDRARALSRLGWCRYVNGDLPGAAESFTTLVRRLADAAEAEEALYMLARIRLEAGDTEAAKEASDEYLRRYPEGRWRADVLFTSADSAGPRALETLLAEHGDSPLVPRALLQLGDDASEAERYEEAAERYRAILRDHPRSEVVPQAAYGLGWCLYQTGNYDQSAELLAQLNDRDTDPELAVAALELCVWAHRADGNAGAATEAWRSFARACDDEARVFEGARTVVAAWRDAGQPQRAQHVLDELLGTVDDPSLAVGVLLEGAYLALEEGDVDRADAQVQVAARRAKDDPQLAEASFFVGEARFAAGDLERAILLYRSAIGADSPVRADALYKLGFALLREGDLAGAEQAFSAVVEDHRRSELWGESLFLLGEARFRAERFAEAAEALERLRREAPDHEVMPKALFRLGLSLGRLERWEPCQAVLAELARTAPEFPNLAEAELWRGRALAARRNARAARQAFERVTSMDRGELAAQARIGLGGLLEDEGRIDEALSEYLRVAVLYGHETHVAEALLRAGSCLEELGDTDKALKQYREVVSRMPDSPAATRAAKRIRALESR